MENLDSVVFIYVLRCKKIKLQKMPFYYNDFQWYSMVYVIRNLNKHL